MTDTYTLSVEAVPDPSEVALIRTELSAWNRQHGADDAFNPLTIVVHDHYGHVMGGLLGGTYWGWLVIEILWLAEPARHQGLGARLLQRAEQLAIARGCHAAHLDTMSFQAPTFYQQHGYTVFGVLEDMPRGQQRYFLKKDLTAQRAPEPASRSEMTHADSASVP